MGAVPKEMFAKITALLLAATSLSVRLTYGPRTVDDAFISFRYARNIADGVGFVFNRGEHVLGTTTPLFTLVLSLFCWMGVDLSLAAWWFSSLLDVGTTLLIYRIIWRCTGSILAAALGAILFAVSSGSIIFAGGGMESSLFVFGVTLSMSFFLDQHFNWAATTAAFAALTRPEGVLLLLVMGALYIFLYHQMPWRMIGISLLIGLPWLLFATLYFGSPLPHAMIAKRSTYALPPLTALRSLLDYLVDYTFPLAGVALVRSLKYGCLIMMFLLAVVTELSRKKQLYQQTFVALWLFPALYLALYAVANPPVWEWYALPIVVPAIILTSSGLFYGMRVALRSLGITVRILPGIFVALLMIVGSAGAVEIRHTLSTDVRIGRELIYKAIAQQLSHHVSIQTKVAAPEIGALGYYLPTAVILDTQGLVSPISIRHQQMMQGEGMVNGSVPLSLIVEELPEFIVAPESLIRYSLLDSQWFSTNYHQIMSFDSNVWGSSGILVFARAQNVKT